MKSISRLSVLSCLFLCVLCVLCGEFLSLINHSSAEPAKKRDPAAWGSDHVGKPLPEFVTGDECLFCHRNDIGPFWPKNRHQLTLREASADAPALVALKKETGLKERAAEVKYLLGGNRRQRFLKSAEAYGRLEMLSAEWAPAGEGKTGKLL